MKFYNLFSGKNRKIFSICPLLKILSKVLSVNIFFLFHSQKDGKRHSRVLGTYDGAYYKGKYGKKIE